MGSLTQKQINIDLFDEVKRLQKENAAMLERIPHTADGHPIFIGDEVWFYEEDSREALSAKVDSIYGKSPVHGHVYPGKFVIGADWYEDGDAKFYHTKEAVLLPGY